MKSLTSYKELKSFQGGLDALGDIAKEILDILPQNAIVSLSGDLAAGKTTLVKEIAKVLKLDDTPTSPTFSLQQIYGDRVFHYDFYRLGFDSLIDLGLIDEFEKEGLHFVEWMPNELRELLLNAGFEIYSIRIDILEDKKREYIVEVISA